MPPSRTKKPKHSGAESRRFVYQSFTQKIAALKIDPIRRVRRLDAEPDQAESYFRAALDRWTEDNLSTPFQAFSRQARPLSESLPLILHHKTQLFATLIASINEQDVLSLQPLLELMTHFAHDLGVQFEPFFQETVLVLSKIVQRHVDVLVIEWVFNAFAYLLKYLSRLLAADLVPTYDIFAPLLGKKHKKDFVNRFAAEALSFLIRKAKGQALKAVVRHAARDFELHDSQEYRMGLMTLFAESCKGPERNIHSRAPFIIGAMLEVDGAAWSGVVEGVFIAITHHTTRETFAPIMETLFNHLETGSLDPRFLYIIVTARKGDRISDWGNASKLALLLLQDVLTVSRLRGDSVVWEALKAATAVMAYAGQDVVMLQCSRISESSRRQGDLFLPFCKLLAGLSLERFKTFFARDFQRFVKANWSEREQLCCLLLPSFKDVLEDSNSFSEDSPFTSCAIKALTSGTPFLASRYLDILACLKLIPNPSICSAALTLLLQVLQEVNIVGNATLAGKTLQILPRDSQLPLSLLASTFPVYGKNVAFLTGMVSVFHHHHSAFEFTQIRPTLLSNLSSPVALIRKITLYILQLFKGDTASVQTALLIESTPLVIQNQRNIAMYIRRLGQDYQSADKNSWEREIAIRYCFGLMTVKYAPAWEDAALVLAKIAESTELIGEIAFDWLTRTGEIVEEPGPEDEDRKQSILTAFQCSNVRHVEHCATECLRDTNAREAEAKLRDIFDSENRSASAEIPLQFARSQSLRILCAAPLVAEKRSRLLVPLFFDWAVHDSDDDEPSSKWTLKDKSTMLTIFSSFVNPRVLFKSADVYDTLLSLLTTGDNKVQSLALKAILTWKQPEVKPYADNLENLLDDTRFRDELTLFVQVDEEESSIQTQHRSILMPILLRLLYGRTLSRKHASVGKRGMTSTRTTVLAALANFSEEERGMFVNIALGDLAKLQDSGRGSDWKFGVEEGAEMPLSVRKQAGLVRMIEDLLKQLGATMMLQAPMLMEGLLRVMVHANREISAHQDCMEIEV